MMRMDFTKFPVLTVTLSKSLTVKGPDDLQSQGKIWSANIPKWRRSTKFFFTKQVGKDRKNLIPSFGFCVAQKILFLLFAIWKRK